MAYLIAQGEHPHQRWRRTLPEDLEVELGREAGVYSATWDDRVSRRHARLLLHQRRLEVERSPGSKNPIYFRGQPQTLFAVAPGEHFVIGGTTFTLADEEVAATIDLPQPLHEQTFTAQALKQAVPRGTDQRMAVLGRLPEMIAGAASDNEMVVRLVSMVLAGVPRAAAAAVAVVEPTRDGVEEVRVLHWDRRELSPTPFRPSERLIRKAAATGECVLHDWRSAAPSEGDFTQCSQLEWAFCVPLRHVARGGWTIYVAGGESGEDGSATRLDGASLRDDVKFTELAAAMAASLSELRLLERRQATLSQFFSPVVMGALEGRDPEEVLAPRETEVTVLFCDLRGFTGAAERDADNLFGLLERVSQALGVMTHHILEHGGVVGDFHGDAAMGFWGWPLRQSDAAIRACRAALAIRAAFAAAAARADHPLRDFRVGIGVATGRAVAGKIGSADQVKVTVFGPVANLAARLEGMTRFFEAPLLLDGRTANIVRAALTAEIARFRRVAVVLPMGCVMPVEVVEMLPPAAAYPQLQDEHLRAYEAALDALLDRDWAKANALLHQVPPDDRVKDFLSAYILRHKRVAPADWNGVIPLETK